MTLPEEQPSSIYKKVKSWLTGSDSEKPMPSHLLAQKKSLKMFLSIPEKLLKNLDLNEGFQVFVTRIYAVYSQVRTQKIFHHNMNTEWSSFEIALVSNTCVRGI